MNRFIILCCCTGIVAIFVSQNVNSAPPEGSDGRGIHFIAIRCDVPLGCPSGLVCTGPGGYCVTPSEMRHGTSNCSGPDCSTPLNCSVGDCI